MFFAMQEMSGRRGIAVEVLAGILIPFLGTALGAACVLLAGGGMSKRLQRAMMGFSAGVMTAASVWSLLMPAMEMRGDLNELAFLPAAAGMLLGAGFLYLVDRITHIGENSAGKLTLAVTLHNIPEGMAVGVALAGALSGRESVTMAAALALSVGIAVQNIPEGAIVSMPVQLSGRGKAGAFRAGVLSGTVEPAGSVAAILLWTLAESILPYMLGFAAGSMLYVVAEELLPQAAGEDAAGPVNFLFGFLIMMALDNLF